VYSLRQTELAIYCGHVQTAAATAVGMIRITAVVHDYYTKHIDL